MFYEILVAGTIWFWLILAVLTVLAAIMCRIRWEGLGIFCLGFFLLTWWLLGDLAEWIRPDPMRLLWYPLGYVAIGFCWCLPKWIIFLDKVKRLYLKHLAYFIDHRKTGQKGPLTKDDWKAWSDNAECYCGFSGLRFTSDTGILTPPQFNNNKERIAGWIVLWPWSIIETMLGDVIKRIVDKIVDLNKWLFQAISNWMFRGL